MMKTLFRNFSHTFRRFPTTSLMNLLGLGLAFASFFILMAQVDYDANFNKGIKGHEKIFRVEINPGEEYDWQLWMARPLAELIGNSSTHIRDISIQPTYVSSYDLTVNEHRFHEKVRFGFGNFIRLFHPQMIAGSEASIEQPHTLLIPESMALRLFQTRDAVGKQLFFNKQDEWTVGGVYRDFPENSLIGDCILITLNPQENKDNWRNWNYFCFLSLDDAAHVRQVESDIKEELSQFLAASGETIEGLPEIRLTSIADSHFSPVGNKGASSRTTVYLLCCIAFLIVGIAGINYMNFSLAETPMRIKSINTQKVLGATTGSLRAGLLAESVLISLCGFVLAMLFLYLLKDTGLQELVSATLSLSKHPRLVGITLGISLLIGILAGIYPAWYVTSFPTALALKGSFGLSPKGKLLRTGLVCFQFLISFILIIGVGIMYQQSNYIRTSEYGYDKEAILIGNMNTESKRQKEAIVSELTRIPGVEGVAFSQFVLSSGDDYMSWGRGSGDRNMFFDVLPVDSRYLEVMGIRITEGRNFRQGDGDVYIFNEAARTKYPWLKVNEPINPGDYTVVGFCENIRFSTFHSDDTTRPMAFFLYGKDHEGWPGDNFLNVRIARGQDKVEIIRTLQEAMKKFSPGHDFNFRFIDKILDNTYRNELRFVRQFFLFSLLAIVICIIGVFGLTLFESEYRRKEIGIRKIMGSSTWEILYMFNRNYLLILTGCFLVAAPFGWWIGHEWLQSFSEKTPICGWIFLASFLTVTLITLVTVTVQSWKNACENPVHSIKTE